MVKVLVMAGGTGGHIFPALAVADVLQQKGASIEWLGTRKGLESKLVPANDYPIHYIDIGGLRGKGIKTLLLLPFKLLKAIYQTVLVYKRIKPDVILGLGGFVTGPGGLVGRVLGKPLVLHEQNAIAGLTNKILYRIANSVLTAFPGVFKKTNKVSVIGNPVRKEIAGITEPEQRFNEKWPELLTAENNNDAMHSGSTLNLLIIGGSLGATALNEIIPKALAKLIENEKFILQDFDRIHIRHQCGAKHLDSAQKHYDESLSGKSKAIINVEIESFIDDMAASYSWADLVICRSGALTVSELAAAGVASILVPFPYAVDDHQTANANYLVNNSAAILIDQKQLNEQSLTETLIKLDKQQLKQMAINARKMAMTNAAEIVADQCLALAS